MIVVLAILGGVALPKFIDYADDAKEAADEGALGGMRTAIQDAYLQHRLNNSPSSEWITSASDIGTFMSTGELPEGIAIVGARLEDQRGNRYNITAETANSPARITLHTSGGGS